MKLPRHKPTETRGLASVDSSQYVRTGNAQAAAKLATGKIGTVIANFAQEYENRETNRQVTEQDVQTELALGEFDSEHSTREQYTNNEIPEDLKAKHGIQGDGETPAHVVRADWTYNNRLEIIEKQAENIRNVRVRDEWIQQNKNLAARDYSKNLLQRSTEQQVYNLEKNTQDIQVAQKLGHYPVAARLINSLEISLEDRNKMLKTNTQMQQRDQLTSRLLPTEGETPQESITRFDTMINLLQNKDVNTASEIGELERKTWMKEYISAKNRIQTQLNATANGVHKKYVYDANNIINNYKNRVNVKPQAYIDSLNYFKAKGDLAMISKLHSANFIYNMTQKSLSSNHPGDIYQALVSMRTEDLSPQDGANLQQLIDHARDAKELLHSNPVEYLQVNKVVDIEPINIYGDYAAQLKKRVSAISDGEQQIYGDKNKQLLPDTPPLTYDIQEVLTTKELREADNFLNNGSPADVLALATTVQQAMGGKAINYYDQLQKFGLGGIANIASQYALEGNSTLAFSILKGGEILKDDPKFKFTTEEQDYINEATALIDTAFPTAIQRDQIRASITAYAAYVRHEPGKEVNPSILKTMATGGGIYTFNGRMFPNPDKAKSEKQLATWFRRLSPVHFADTNARQAEGVSQEQMGDWFKRKFTKGDILLKPTGQRGSWYFQDKSGFIYTDTKGSLFKLSYQRHIRNTEDDKVNVPTYSPIDKSTLNIGLPPSKIKGQ